jgi:hypothetical protein
MEKAFRRHLNLSNLNLRMALVLVFIIFNILGCKSPTNSVETSSSTKINTATPTIPTVITPSLAFKLPASSPGNNPTPTLTVLDLSAGSTAKIYSDSSCLVSLGTSTSASTGSSVDVTLSTALSPGLTTLYAKSFTPGGSSSSCSFVSLLYYLDTQVLPITSLSLVSPTTDFETDPSPVIRVSPLELGSTINLYSNSGCTTLIGTKVGTDTTEDVTLTLSTPAIYNIYAKQIDKAGNISTCSAVSVRYTYAKSFDITSTTSATNLDALADGICADTGGKCSLRAAFDEVAADSTTPYLFNLEAGTYTIGTGFTKAFNFVKLRGPSELTTILQGTNSSYVFASSGAHYGIALENVQVKNFNVNAATDIFLNPMLSSRKYLFKNVQFKNNNIGINAEGIIASYETGTTLENVLFESNTGSWATFHQWTGSANFKNVYFKDNTNGWSIQLRVCDADLENVTVKGSGAYGIYLNNSLNINAKNLTVTGTPDNALSIDGGIFSSVINITNSTFYNNGLGSTGNMKVLSAGTSQFDLNISNTIFAINGVKTNCSVTTMASSNPPAFLFKNSLFDEASCGAGVSNLVGLDPLLNALSTPSPYVAVLVPQAASPAIDAGDNLVCAATDQTGLLRPVNYLGGGAICDIGAVEVP